MSPTIKSISIDGYRFFFQSDEGRHAVHVHVKTPSGVVLWWLGKDGVGEVTLKKNYGANDKDVRQSKRLTKKHYDVIVNAWEEHFRDHYASTEEAHVYLIEDDGFWLYANEELFWVGFDRYPVFRYATDDEILDFERHFEDFFHWPSVDADLGLEDLRTSGEGRLRAVHERERGGWPKVR